jgi:hypothetical protein
MYYKPILEKLILFFSINFAYFFLNSAFFPKFHSICKIFNNLWNMYFYVIINFAKRALFRWNAWPQTSRPMSFIGKNMYLCENECLSGVFWLIFFKYFTRRDRKHISFRGPYFRAAVGNWRPACRIQPDQQFFWPAKALRKWILKYFCF